MSENAVRELTLLLLEYLEDQKYTETVRLLEKESGVFFNMKYFEQCLTYGDWDDAESYLSGFTKLDENEHSSSTFFEIRKQRYLEALDRHDLAKALEILQKDLKVVSDHNKGTYNELALVLMRDNVRENEELSIWSKSTIARKNLIGVVKELIEINPVFRDKLRDPSFEKSRLTNLISKSLNWQHSLCTNSKEPPDFKTLFHDHSCGPIAFKTSPATNPIKLPNTGRVPPRGAHGPSHPAAAQQRAPPARWMANRSSVRHQRVNAGPNALTAPNLKRHLPEAGGVPPIRTDGPSQPLAAQHRASLAERMTNPFSVPHQRVTAGPNAPNSARAEDVFKRSRASGVSNEVNSMLPNVLPIPIPRYITHTLCASEELPKIVIANLGQGSAVISMEFHPQHQSLLLVGTSIGNITVWEVGSKQRLLSRTFKIWDIAACSATLQAPLIHPLTASVNRVIWSPDGCFIGVAYSIHIVHIYSYHGRDDLRDHLEIAAHVGNVTDLAFFDLNKKLCITSCGEDKIVKVWDAATGEKLYTFEGHEAPVFSVYQQKKFDLPIIFSTDFNGKIMAWVFFQSGPVFRYDAPGYACTRIAYSTDGKRLFSCGTNIEGESSLLEWNDEDGVVKRVYNGLRKQTVGIVEFDATKNRFLVAGDDSSVKFWDMDNADLFDSTDTGGGLPACPCVRFNKDGILLAVSTSENGIKVLANAKGIESLHYIWDLEASESPEQLGSMRLVESEGSSTSQ